MYNEKQQKTMDNLDKGLKKVERQAQKNLNSRLDNMRFCDYTRAEFDGSAPHADTDISFVLETDQTISLYKGDTQLSSQGSSADVLYSALVGYGTGLGGERTGDTERSLFDTSSRESIPDESPWYLGYYTQNMEYWINIYDEQWGYSGASRSTRANITGKGDVTYGDLYAVIICNRSKLIVNPNVRQPGGFGRYVSGTSLLYRKTFYVRRILSDGYGPREELTFSIEPYAMGFSNRRTYTPYWRIKVSNGTDTRYLNGTYMGSYDFYMAYNNNGYFPSAGFVLGCESIRHTADDVLYGQIRGPGLIWNGSTPIIESSSNPYGLYYDISTGDPLDPPTIEFYSEDERDMAYCLCLPRSVNI